MRLQENEANVRAAGGDADAFLFLTTTNGIMAIHLAPRPRKRMECSS
jgi:hypothetical protein